MKYDSINLGIILNVEKRQSLSWKAFMIINIPEGK